MYITDKDFVPHSLCYGWYLEENEMELYQIVYGVLNSKMTYDDIYDLVVRISKEQKSEVVKRFKLKNLKNDIGTMIDKLNKIEKLDNDVGVLVPFGEGYYATIQDTISHFKMAVFTIEAILEQGDSDMEIPEKASYTYPIEDLGKLMAKFLASYMERTMEDGEEQAYWFDIIVDEIIRRGIRYTPQLGYDYEFHRKSKYYNQPQLFLETVTSDKHFKLRKYADDTNIPSNSPGKKGKVKEQARLIYFMIKSLSEEISEKKHKDKLVALINYVLLNNAYNTKDAKNNNIRRYVDGFKKITSESESRQFYKEIKEELEEYGFDAPDIIKIGLSKTGHHNVR
jgi:hypothetical protein